MKRLDLTPFGFTPTEGLVYEVLLERGPGTGYAIARAAGLARANAYGALEGLVTKGAARAEGDRPRRFQPESPTTLVARLATRQGQALTHLSDELESLAVPSTPTLVEIDSSRGALQVIGHDVARATQSVCLLLPPDAYPLLVPALRRPAAAGLTLTLCSTAPVSLGFGEVETITTRVSWPGAPVLAVVDDRSAVIAAREGADVRGHWGTAPTFVAAARAVFDRMRAA